jgi:general secretion pathway protein C
MQALRRHFWIVSLLMLSIAAWLGARGATALASTALPIPPMPAPSPPPTALEPPHALKSADAIPAAFDSRRIGGELPACGGVKVLVIAASSNPDWSFCALSTTGSPKSVLRRRGGEIDGKRIERVEWDRVVFDDQHRLCEVELHRAKAAVAAPPPPSAGMKGVVRNSATDFEVERAVVDRILESQEELFKAVRIVPEQANGRVAGIRLYGIRPDGMLGALGLENGDRLDTINGFELSSPERALEVYARLRTADRLAIAIQRRGVPMNIDYAIR